MIPHTPEAIGFITQRLMTHVLPDLRTNYGVADIALIGTLLGMVGQDFERAAQARLEDIREMRTIFAAAEALLDHGSAHDRELAARVHEARGWPLDDLRISVLDDIHAFHSRLLIDVHARIEQQAGDAAVALDREIWAHLERHAERHRYEAAV